MILSSVCLSIDMNFSLNPHDTFNKCDTLPTFPNHHLNYFHIPSPFCEYILRLALFTTIKNHPFMFIFLHSSFFILHFFISSFLHFFIFHVFTVYLQWLWCRLQTLKEWRRRKTVRKSWRRLDEDRRGNRSHVSTAYYDT